MKNNLEGLVDLETEDEELADLMINYYKGKLNKNQIRIIVKESRTLYEFKHISAIYALKFLDEYAQNNQYTLKKSSDEKILKSQKIVTIPIISAN